MGGQPPGCLGSVPVHRQCRNPGDVPLYPCEQDADAQEDGADSQVDAEVFIRLRGPTRNE
ncbi:hypothetical protein [uncultured Thiohalocapsa sp.]|uniref:hypothetical protein n=1 Tax=uncultured Thiohalocapsa sp. TaxID=768990 RepID=UPI0025DE285F|nr:hypothetical protein [uncultured Thiohalocapsa sp.]